jgi:hypothetical protein
MTTEPQSPEDVAAVAAVAELLWEIDGANRSMVAESFQQARAAGTTHRYENAALQLWRRGWLNEVAVVSDAGGPNSD